MDLTCLLGVVGIFKPIRIEAPLSLTKPNQQLRHDLTEAAALPFRSEP